MELELKPDFDEAAKRWAAYLQGEIIDRPVVCVWTREEGVEPVHAGSYRDMMYGDPVEVVERHIASARTLGELLYSMSSHRERVAFLNSLARSGEQKTTLERRLLSHNVWAKTGSLEYVRSLSGYVQTTDGRMLAFTVLVNNYSTSASRIRRSIDEIVTLLATGEA